LRRKKPLIEPAGSGFPPCSSVEGMISSSLRQEDREKAKMLTLRSKRVMDEVFIASWWS
jgi:hypothetical protein